MITVTDKAKASRTPTVLNTSSKAQLSLHFPLKFNINAKGEDLQRLQLILIRNGNCLKNSSRHQCFTGVMEYCKIVLYFCFTLQKTTHLFTRNLKITSWKELLLLFPNCFGIIFCLLISRFLKVPIWILETHLHS